MKIFCLCVLVTFPALAVFAQEAAAGQAAAEQAENEDDYLLMENPTGLTVEGERSVPVEPAVSPYGRRNEVSAEQIHEQGSGDILDALRNVPGVSFSKRNAIGGDTGTSLYVRGRGASHPSVETITNFDGVPRNGAIYGQSMPDSFSTGIAERIDVYKSPQPSAFGAGYALVDIVPRRMKNEGWLAEAGTSLGSFYTVQETASFGLKYQFFDIFAAQSWNSTAGHTGHSAAYQQGCYLNTGFDLGSNWNLRLLGNLVNARSERPRREDQRETDILPAFKTNSVLTTLTVNNRYAKAEGYVKGYYSRTDFYWEDESPTVPGEYSIQTMTIAGARAKETLRLWDGGEIIAGSDFDVTLVRNLDHNEVNPSVRTVFPDMFLISPYITASHTFGSAEGLHASPQAGVRGYIHNIWKDALAPQAGFLAGYKNTDIHGNFAIGYVYPAPANIQNLVNQNGVSRADLQSVEPEHVYHYEGGVSHRFPHLAALGASVFYDDGRNRIVANDIVPKNASVISYFRILGTEFYGNVSPVNDVNLFAGGTWIVRIQARGDDGVVVGKLPFTPNLSLSAGASWKLSCFKIPYIKNISISGDYRYLAGVYAANTLQFNAGFKNSAATTKLDDQHILRLRLAYQFGYAKWHIHKAEAFINVDNVLNQQYEYWPGYRMPGITVTGGLRLVMN